MKKIFTTLMCVATVAMFIGCGGKSKKVDSTQKDEEAVEKVFETGAYGEGTKAAAQEAFKGIGLTLEQIEPDYKYLDNDTLKIFNGVVYKGLYEGLAVFIKADKADVSREEFENYVRKIYDVTKKRQTMARLSTDSRREARRMKRTLNGVSTIYWHRRFWDSLYMHSTGDLSSKANICA